MPDFDPSMDGEFREYADLELRCHRLLLDGKEESPEMQWAEDRLEELWPKLDDEQQRSIRGLASDLSWIRRKGEPPPKGRKTGEEVAAKELEELRAAKRSGDWNKYLHMLRLCAPAMPVSSLAKERELAYDAIKLRNYAQIFHEFNTVFTVADRRIDGEGAILMNNLSNTTVPRAAPSRDGAV